MPHLVEDYFEEAAVVTTKAQEMCMKLILLCELYETNNMNINDDDDHIQDKKTTKDN